VGTLHVGTPAELRSAALGGSALAGHVNYIDTKLNEETRTARVRVELANPGERLKAGMFVQVGFQTNTGAVSGEELMVPSTAVQRIGDRSVVFIPKEGAVGTFEARDLELGGEVDGYHRVLSGIKLGERVVTKGSFTLKTQLMKGALGEE
jgi:multidrug efflux pump subunit AcrA (membrane-fusion protein)